MLQVIDGDGPDRETLAEKIARLESEIADLKDEVESERERGDIQYDRAERAIEALDALENGEDVELAGYEHLIAIDKDRLETYEQSERTLSEIEGIIESINEAYQRINMGVLSDIDEVIKLTNDLLEKNYE